MPTFINQTKMENTYGQLEIIRLTDRTQPLTGAVNVAVLNANIDDAEAEIMTALGCCFDAKAIYQVYIDGNTIPAIEHWAKVFTRLHLYSSLERDDSQVTKAYLDCKQEMADLCKCGILLDSAGNEIPRLIKTRYVEDTKCYCCGPCSCGYFKRCV